MRGRDWRLEYPWALGAAWFYRDYPHRGRLLYLALECSFGSLDPELALLDTAAAWSIVGAETAALLARELGAPLGRDTIATWHGRYEGELHRLTVTLPATEGRGADYAVDATCMVIPDWPFASVLAYRGCLERIRLALDPGSRPETETLYFGAVS